MNNVIISWQIKAQQVYSGKGQFYGESLLLYWNLAEGTTASDMGAVIHHLSL